MVSVVPKRVREGTVVSGSVITNHGVGEAPGEQIQWNIISG